MDENSESPGVVEIQEGSQDTLIYQCNNCANVHLVPYPPYHTVSCTFGEEGLLKLRNDAGSMFLRTRGSSPTWFFKPPDCEQHQLCDRLAVDLEDMFGKLAEQNSAELQKRLFPEFGVEVSDGNNEMDIFEGDRNSPEMEGPNSNASVENSGENQSVDQNIQPPTHVGNVSELTGQTRDNITSDSVTSEGQLPCLHPPLSNPATIPKSRVNQEANDSCVSCQDSIPEIKFPPADELPKNGVQVSPSTTSQQQIMNLSDITPVFSGQDLEKDDHIKGSSVENAECGLHVNGNKPTDGMSEEVAILKTDNDGIEKVRAQLDFGGSSLEDKSIGAVLPMAEYQEQTKPGCSSQAYDPSDVCCKSVEEHVQSHVSYQCSTCGVIHEVVPPRAGDLEVPWFDKTSRPSQFHRTTEGLWLFTNFRDQVFIRICADLPTWQFRPRQCQGQNTELGPQFSVILEDVYGRFIDPPWGKREVSWLRGYVQHETGDGAYFSEANYTQMNISPPTEPHHAINGFGNNNAKEPRPVYDDHKEFLPANREQLGEAHTSGYLPRNVSKNSNESAGIITSFGEPTNLSTVTCLSLNPKGEVLEIEEGQEAPEYPGMSGSLNKGFPETPGQHTFPRKTNVCAPIPTEKGGAAFGRPKNEGTFLSRTPITERTCNKTFMERPSMLDMYVIGLYGMEWVPYQDTESLVDSQPSGKGLYEKCADMWKCRKALQVLRSNLKDEYEYLIKTICFPLKTCHIPNILISELFDMEVVSRNESNTGPSPIPKQGSSPDKKILITGPPRFGKTTLCVALALHWAYGLPSVDGYDICIYYPLDKMKQDEDLTRSIVAHSYALLCTGEEEEEKNILEQVLIKNSKTTLLLLDGYERLSSNMRQALYRFIKSSPIFADSTVVVTSRTESDDNILSTFERFVILHGFSIKHLRTLLHAFSVPQETITKCLPNIRKEKLSYLFSLPSYFAFMAVKVIYRNYKDTSGITDLYSLLENILEMIFSDKLILPKVTDTLGRVCLEKLSVVETVFHQHELGSDLERLEKFNIVYCSNHEQKSWKMVSKVLTVFFATAYLRMHWSLTEDRQKFLEEVFCFRGCTGDYVMVDKEEPKTYYVGLIPEIFLNCDDTGQDVFEMFYDAERVEHSRAFDSVNLLVRVSDKFLPRFGFRRHHSEDQRLQELFSPVLNSILLEDYYVVCSFYDNLLEHKKFVKILVQDESSYESALCCVVRATDKSIKDRLYLEFLS